MNVYVASKFRLREMENNLINLDLDFRTHMIKGGIMQSTDEAPFINEKLKVLNYCGPFYCEKAHYDKSFTSTDCEVVVSSELKAVKDCDVFICIFEEGVSCGSCVELMYAIANNKKIIILYSEVETKYDIKNGNWFAIMAASLLGNTTIKTFKKEDNLLEIVERELISYVSSI